LTPADKYDPEGHIGSGVVTRSVTVYICAKQGLAANSSPHPMARSV